MRLTAFGLATLVLSGGMLLAQQPQPQLVTPDQNPTTNAVTTNPPRNATTKPTQNPGVQDQTSNPAQTPASSADGEEQTRIEGCVIGPLGGSYMLVAHGKQYRLVGDYNNIRGALFSYSNNS